MTSRFGQSSSSSGHFATSAKKTPSDPGYYDDNYYRTDTKTKTKKTFDSDDETPDRHLSTNGYRSGPTKASSLSRFDEEDEDHYSPSRSNARAPSNSLHSSYTTPKPTSHSTYDNYDRSPSASKLHSKSKFDDDDDDDYVGDNGYPKSNQATRSSMLSKTNYYSSSYDDHPTKAGINNSRARFDDDDHFGTQNRSTSGSRFRSNNLYDDWNGQLKRFCLIFPLTSISTVLSSIFMRFSFEINPRWWIGCSRFDEIRISGRGIIFVELGVAGLEWWIFHSSDSRIVNISSLENILLEHDCKEHVSNRSWFVFHSDLISRRTFVCEDWSQVTNNKFSECQTLCGESQSLLTW